MQETAQQYITRILGSIEGKNVMEILASTPKQVARLIEARRKTVCRSTRRPENGR